MKSTTISTKQGDGQEDVIDLVHVLLLLWRSRYLISALTLAATAVGVVIAMTSPSIYHAQATIALKESKPGGDASRLLSSFGGMGGIFASQLGFGSTNLDKIEILLKGHELAESVIITNNLLPILFHKKWNLSDSSWHTKDTSRIPSVRDGIEHLKKNILEVSVDAKKNVLKVGVYFHDPQLAKRLVEYYLNALNEKIRSDVRVDAENNRRYLEQQISHTTDPILREKIQNMIAFEIEKNMLVSLQSFEIVDKPIAPIQRSKPNRKLIVAMAFLLGLMASCFGVLGLRMAKNFKQEVDRATV